MLTYTTLLQESFDAISFEDEDFMAELLQVAQLFRPFHESLDAFISERGYTGDINDVEARVAFIRDAFEKAEMTPPREIREWFAGQPVKRDTVFQI